MRALVAQGHGLVTAARLAEAGIDIRVVRDWVRHGVLIPVRHGVYTTADLWAAWDDFRDRPLARIRAARLCQRVRHVVSHDSAGIVQEMRLLRPQESEVHFTREDMRGHRSKAGVHHHGAAYLHEQVRLVAGIPVLDVPRTVVDLAREHGYRAGLVAADGALHAGVARADLRAAAQQMWRWPNSLTVRAVVEDADAGSESVGETLTREFIVELGLGLEVETQFPVPVPGGVAWCDVRVGRQMVEFDGRIKYQQPEQGGVADRELEQILWDERRRERDICANQLGVSRLVYADFWGDRRARAIERFRAEFEATAARFGTELPPHLAEFAARMRGQRRRTA